MASERSTNGHPRRVPEGRCSLDLRLARVVLRLVDLPTSREPFVTERYGTFATEPGDEAADLRVACRESTDGLLVPLPGRGASTTIDVRRETEQRYRIRSHWQDGWIDLDRGAGELVLTDRGWDRFAMSVENFVRVSLQLLAIHHGAFLMHTAGVLDDGQAFLFFGPSGAGKSTATALSKPRTALSDDMVLIDPADEPPTASTVPFHMVYPADERVRGSWPIRAAFRLRQAPGDRLEQLSPARAVATVSASVPYVHELGVEHRGLTALVGALCRRVPVFDLEFTRSGRFWDLIAGALDGDTRP